MLTVRAALSLPAMQDDFILFNLKPKTMLVFFRGIKLLNVILYLLWERNGQTHNCSHQVNMSNLACCNFLPVGSRLLISRWRRIWVTQEAKQKSFTRSPTSSWPLPSTRSELHELSCDSAQSEEFLPPVLICDPSALLASLRPGQLQRDSAGLHARRAGGGRVQSGGRAALHLDRGGL